MSDYSIKLQNVSLSIGRRKILKNITFRVKKNGVHGFLGPNGAGKSTTMRLITGSLAASSGKILINEKEMSPLEYSLKNIIGYLPENPPLYEDMDVDSYLSFLGKLRGMTKTELSLAKEKVLLRLDLEDVVKRRIGNLSRGFKQRVGFSAALLHSPEIIVLDEPTLGLDPQAIEHMRNLMAELSCEHTVILSSHNLREVEKICDEVTLIHEGKILVSGNIQKLKEHTDKDETKVMIRAYGVDFSLSLKLRELDYVKFVELKTDAEDELGELQVQLIGGTHNQGRLVSDLVRYGCSPVEVKTLNNLENFFLQEVRK